VNWTERILGFPVRAAAVDDFLRDLKAKGTGDLNAVLSTLNEAGLCREALDHWVGNGWIVPAPNSPTVALAGPAFRRELTLRGFCGEEVEPQEETPPPAAAGEAATRNREEEAHRDGRS
jgi:hypothetical protein